MHQHGRLRSLVCIGVVSLTTLVGASMAAAAPPPGTSMEGTGTPPSAAGLFSKAALAQEHCADNGRMWATYEGGGPWCVAPWTAGKDNGGATSPGVTGDSVTVVAYVPNPQMVATQTGSGKPVNQATKQVPPLEDVVRDTQAAYENAVKQFGTYQLWGRKVDVQVVSATGRDEAAQRADAVAVLAKKPFMVLESTDPATGGAEVFSAMLAQKKIVVVSASTDAQNATAQSPYRWNFGSDPSATEPLAGVFVGKSLSGKPAKWAGDDTLKTKPRSFGLVSPSTGFDEASFERYLQQNGGKLTDKASYDPADVPGAQAQLTTVVSRFKSAGVTSVVLASDPPIVQGLMAAATAQDYHPEWVYTGYAYQDYDFFGRTNDQSQMAHAFGLATLGPYVNGTYPPSTVFAWYWGANLGNTYSIMSGEFETLYTGIHYAGPDLTPKNFQKGLYAAPAITPSTVGISTGASGYGKTVGLPYDEFARFGSDRSLIWWDGNQTGPSQVSGSSDKGVMMFLNDGAASKYTDFTKATPKFFEPSASTVQITAASQFPDDVVPSTLPCTGCPSGGATSGSTS